MSSALLPLSVAIVGQHDLLLQDIPALEASVQSVLAGLQRGAPDTPIMVLSALSGSADQLAARVAVRMGLRLVVPLTLNEQDYLAQLSTDALRSSCAELLSAANERVSLPADVEPIARSADGTQEQVVAYFVKHSQILIALWDGDDSALSSGIARAVQYQLEGVPSRLDPARTMLDPPDTGPVYHIWTRASRDAAPPDKLGVVECRLPLRLLSETVGDAHARIIHRMNEFNRDSLAMISTGGPAERGDATPLVPAETMAMLSEPLQHEARAVAEADRLAGYFQQKTNGVINAFMALAMVDFFSFEVYAYYYSGHPLIMLLYVLPVVIAYGIFMVAKRRDYQNKYLDYRALAEGLRVQWFWHLGGINESVADYYLRKQRTELDWIRHAIGIWNVRVSTHGVDERGDRLQMLQDYWVADQARYYARAARRDGAMAATITTWSNRLFLIGTGIAVVHVAWQLLANSDPITPVLLVMSTVLIIAGLMVVFLDKRGFVTQAKQFGRMTELYERARPLIERAWKIGDRALVRKLHAELGREALAENGDWVMMHRERPLEVPKLG